MENLQLVDKSVSGLGLVCLCLSLQIYEDTDTSLFDMFFTLLVPADFFIPWQLQRLKRESEIFTASYNLKLACGYSTPVPLAEQVTQDSPSQGTEKYTLLTKPWKPVDVGKGIELRTNMWSTTETQKLLQCFICFHFSILPLHTLFIPRGPGPLCGLSYHLLLFLSTFSPLTIGARPHVWVLFGPAQCSQS